MQILSTATIISAIFLTCAAAGQHMPLYQEDACLKGNAIWRDVGLNVKSAFTDAAVSFNSIFPVAAARMEEWEIYAGCKGKTPFIVIGTSPKEIRDFVKGVPELIKQLKTAKQVDYNTIFFGQFFFMSRYRAALKQDLALHDEYARGYLQRQLEKVELEFVFANPDLPMSEQTYVTVYARLDLAGNPFIGVSLYQKGLGDRRVGPTEYANIIALDRKNPTTQAFLKWLGIR